MSAQVTNTQLKATIDANITNRTRANKITPALHGATEKAIVDYVDQQDGILKPYKVYVAQVSQTGTATPVVTVFENTIGNIVWARPTSAGVYTATLSGAFPSGKTCIMPSFSSNFSGNSTSLKGFTITRGTADRIDIIQYDSSGTGIDGFSQTIEIRVYN